MIHCLVPNSTDPPLWCAVRSGVITVGPWLQQTSIATVLAILFAAVGDAQTPARTEEPKTADFAVQVWGQAGTDFTTRVSKYVALRSRLEEGLPARTITDDVAEIRRAERALARKIRVARKGARQGELFTPIISREFRKALVLEMTNNTHETLMDDNPGVFFRQINGSYPKSKPFSTVPVNVLTRLPRLPEDIEYRFLGRDLILHDTRANVILDRIPCALPGHAHVGCPR